MYSFALKAQRAVADARLHDAAWQLCLLLLALSRYDRHVLRVFLLFSWLIVLCCAGLAVVDGRRWSTAKHASSGVVVVCVALAKANSVDA